MDIRMHLKETGKRILQRRKSLGLTQEALAEKADLTPQAVSLYESGKRAMRSDSVLKLAAALQTSADYLLTGEIIDRDKLILSEKLDRLTSEQVRAVETIIDSCIFLSHHGS